MTDIVFATCLGKPEITPSDALAAEALEASGARVSAAPWNGPQAPFERAGAIVVRSTWDYPHDPIGFEAWLATLDRYDHVFNSPRLMQWNYSKRYLLELAERGAPTPPTIFVEPDADAIAEAMTSLGVGEAIVKPEFSASAVGLSRVRRDDNAGLQEAAGRLKTPGLVQPVLDGVRTHGETSMMFIEGAFTHAALKRPKAGSVLVQEEHGGTITPVNPPDWAIAEAGRVLGHLAEPPLYARVDAIILDGSLQLMEVELIEPELFFSHHPPAAKALATALLNRLN